jgi:hypothetical protein
MTQRFYPVVRPSRAPAYFHVVAFQWTRVALNPFRTIQWSTWIPWLSSLADVSLARNLHKLESLTLTILISIKTTRVREGKKHTQKRESQQWHAHKSRHEHTKHSATSSPLDKCSILNHNDPDACLRSLGILGCSMEAWCFAPCA